LEKVAQRAGLDPSTTSSDVSFYRIIECTVTVNSEAKPQTKGSVLFVSSNALSPKKESIDFQIDFKTGNLESLKYLRAAGPSFSDRVDDS
jgi:hypothetical protein